MQLVSNIRKFKGTDKTVVQTDRKTMDVAGNFSQWSDIAVTYTDFTDGAFRRDAVGTGGIRQINTSGRNGLLYSKVTQDANNLYFYVQTQADITPYDRSEGSWMQLYLDLDGKKENDWNGYEYVVNGKAKSNTATTLAKYNGSTFEAAGDIPYQVYGNQMMVAVPKALLGITGETVTFEFKWADSREAYTSLEDFYENGDVMPVGRFNYQFNGQ
jgi:hypothetical protein